MEVLEDGVKKHEYQKEIKEIQGKLQEIATERKSKQLKKEK